MSAIATVLARMGHRVSGSDLRESRALERLRLLGVDRPRRARAPRNLPADARRGRRSRPRSPRATPRSSPRASAASRCCDAPTRCARSSPPARTIAVAGSHGKTTTSSMLALILRAAGWHPSFLIGGDLNEVGTNAVFDDGEWLVVEADESDGTFLELAPHDARSSPTSSPTTSTTTATSPRWSSAFETFVGRVPGVCVLCADDADRRRDRAPASTPASSPTGSPTAPTTGSIDYEGGRGGTQFTLDARRRARSASSSSRCPVGTTRSNAAGAAAMALELGVPFDAVTRALGGFGGVARRFQFRGERDGVTYVDDYAHLPSEVDAMIRAAREGGWGRVVAVFQPHRYTRTAALWRDFADAFAGADARRAHRRVPGRGAAAAGRVGPAGPPRRARRPPGAGGHVPAAPGRPRRARPAPGPARRRRAHPGRRRPHHRTRRVAGAVAREPRAAEPALAERARTRPPGARSSATSRSPSSPPTASVVRSRCWRGSGRADDARGAGRAWSPPPRRRCSDRPRLEPARRRRRVRRRRASCSAASSSAVDLDAGAGLVRAGGARCRCPVLARRSAGARPGRARVLRRHPRQRRRRGAHERGRPRAGDRRRARRGRGRRPRRPAPAPERRAAGRARLRLPALGARPRPRSSPAPTFRVGAGDRRGR